MKIYSSELLSNSQVDSGDLTITAEDQLIITDAANGVYEVTEAGEAATTATNNTYVFGTDPTTGFYISGGSFDTIMGEVFNVTDSTSVNTTLNTAGIAYHYLDGKGQERELGDVLVSAGSFNAGTGVLSLTNRAGYQVVADIDLSAALGGGGGSAATNPTNKIVPVKSQTGVVDVFRDSPIAIDNDAYFNQSGLTLTRVNATSATVTGGTDLNAAGALANDDTVILSTTDSVTGELQSFSATVGSISATGFTATYTSGAPAAGGVTEPSGTAAFAGTFGVTKLGTNTGVTINGDLTVTGTTTTVDSTVVTIADQFLELANTSDTTSGSAVATVDNNSGLIVEGSRTDSGSAITKEYGGLRYNGANQVWEIAVGQASLTGSETTSIWMPLSTSGGTTNKAVVYVASIGAPNGDTARTVGTVTAAFDNVATADIGDITVSAPTETNGGDVTIDIVTRGGSTLLPLNTGDMTIQVFVNNVMIIPEEVTIADDGTDGDVTITLPNNFSSTSQVKVVLIG